MVRYCEEYWEDVNKALKCVPGIDALDGKSILLTGATGMICSSVVELLLQYNHYFGAGIQILLGGRSRERVCARFAGFVEGRDFFFVPYDATEMGEPDASFSAEYIVHGASNADPAMLFAQPVETILSNVTGLNRLLAAACKEQRVGPNDERDDILEEKSCRRLLYLSSSEVYGKRVDTNVETLPESRENKPNAPEEAFREEDYGFVDILNSRAAYPSSKRAAETLCVAYGQEYGLDTVIVRPGHIYGPSITDTDSRASAQFTRNAAKGENIVLKSAGAQLRSYCYMLDCASAILTVLLNGKKGNAYNVSNRNSVVTIRDIAQALANAAGTQVLYEEPSEREKKSYNLMANSSLNAEKLEKLGWKAIFGLEEGAKKTIEFYRFGR